MRTYWYVTAVSDTNNPPRKLDGPFDTREECNKRCMRDMSDTVKQRIVLAILEGKAIQHIPVSFVPHPFVENRAEPVRLVRTTVTEVVRQHPDDLLTKMRALSRGKLSKIANAIGFDVPDSLLHNKAALATRLYRELMAQAG